MKIHFGLLFSLKIIQLFVEVYIKEPIKTMKIPLKKYDNYNYDWCILENNWGTIFTELKINPKQHNIVILEEEL